MIELGACDWRIGAPENLLDDPRGFVMSLKVRGHSILLLYFPF